MDANATVNGFLVTTADIATLLQATANDLLAALAEDIQGNMAAKHQLHRPALRIKEAAV